MDYLRRRLVTYLCVFIIVLNLEFILPRLAPGNAAETLVTNLANSGAARDLLLKRFGLNLPVWSQYLNYLHGIFSWPPNFGFSYQFYPTPVTTLIATRAGWTLLLIAISLVLAFAVSYGMMTLSVLRKGGKTETGATFVSIFLQATPVYFTGLVLLWVFAISLQWFPVFGKVEVGTTGTLDYILSVLWHAVLPVLALTASMVGEIFLVLRGSAQQVMKNDYITAASLRGLKNRIVTMRYVLRNSLLPVVAVMAFSLAGLVSRAILVEAVFGYAGLGDLIVDATFSRDYPVLQGSLFVLMVMIIIGGIIGDLVLVRLDPRLRR
jgi:peptide/nickel transport system permease protein